MESILDKECLACGYIRNTEKEYFCPDYECPSCQRVYKKVTGKITYSTNIHNPTSENPFSIRLKKTIEKFFKLIDDSYMNYQEIKIQKETENKQPFIIKSYKGRMEAATTLFEIDAIVMEKQGYTSRSQNYEIGSYGCAAFLFALLLCFFIIGLPILFYMIIVKPVGKLIVTYKYSIKTDT